MYRHIDLLHQKSDILMIWNVYPLYNAVTTPVAERRRKKVSITLLLLGPVDLIMVIMVA